MTFLLISFLPEISYSDRIWVSFISAKGSSKDSEEGSPPEISIIESNNVHTLLHVTIPGMWVDTVMGPDGFVYQVLEVPDYAYTNDVGLPELTAIRSLLVIPDNADVSMIVQSGFPQVLDDYYVLPHQRPICDNEEWQFEKDEEFYNSDIWFPDEHSEVGDPGIFKYYTVDNVGYIPFSYNPYLRQLKVYPQYTMDVVYSNGSGIPTAVMDSAMAELMRATLWNFEELPYIVDDYAPSYYLIIVPDDFYDQTLLFAKWIEDTYGYITRTKRLSEVGYTYQDIKAYIDNFYNNNHSTDYVLLIGDTDRIPTYTVYLRTLSGVIIIPSDFKYGNVTGDLYPEIAVGRICFDGNIELQFQFNKIMSYYLTEMPPPNPD